MIALQSDRVILYDAETARENTLLTQEVNQFLTDANVQFPIKGMWGKTTNMKPFDWGYFIKDNANSIFNLARSDNEIRLNKVDVPKEVGDIAYIQVSENRKKRFYGYAISRQSTVYLISYPDYKFIPLELDGFDYKSMTFQLLADPLSYIMRYSDGTNYNAVRFNKNYQKQGDVVFN